MKKILFFIFIHLAIFGSLQAQSSHLEFMDIPIDGNLEEFVEKLKNEGFTLEEVDNNIAVMEGVFMDKHCELYIYSSPITKTVRMVTVYLPENKDWLSLKQEFKACREQYRIKYGYNDSHYSYFASPYSEGDGYEIQAIESGKCYFASFWEIEKGMLSVNISEFCQISISYEDAVNTRIADSEKAIDIIK